MPYCYEDEEFFPWWRILTTMNMKNCAYDDELSRRWHIVPNMTYYSEDEIFCWLWHIFLTMKYCDYYEKCSEDDELFWRRRWLISMMMKNFPNMNSCYDDDDKNCAEYDPTMINCVDDEDD